MQEILSIQIVHGSLAPADFAVLVRPILLLAAHEFSRKTVRSVHACENAAAKWVDLVRLICKHAAEELSTVSYIIKRTVLCSWPLPLVIEKVYASLLKRAAGVIPALVARFSHCSGVVWQRRFCVNSITSGVKSR